MSNKTNLVSIIPGTITIIKSLQCRSGLNDEKVIEYAELLRDDSSFDFQPIKAVRITTDERIVVYDGFHRHKAYEIAGRELMQVEYIEGTMKDAEWLAASANKDHGLPRTSSDKRRAVVAALRHDNFTTGSCSMRDIARHVGVSHTMVQDVKVALEKAAGKKDKDEDVKVDFPPEVLEAIEKIRDTNPAAAEALESGAIIKPHDEIIRFTEYEADYQAVLAPLFFGRRMNLMTAIEVVEKKPTDQSTLREAINYARMQKEDIEFFFDNSTAMISVNILPDKPKLPKPVKSGAPAPDLMGI